MGKVLFVATVVKTHIMEFHIPFLKMFKENGWETEVAAKNDYEKPAECVIPYCDKYYDVPFERNPLKFSNFDAYRMIKSLLDNNNYDIIHCHTPVGGAISRLAAGSARKHGTKVLYTAHGFHFYKGARLLNWMFYYPAERILAHQTDVLITINKEDYQRAKSFHAGKVQYVPGVGIDLSRFNMLRNAGDSGKELKKSKRESLGIGEDDFVILSVGELIKRKNHIVVLEALAILKKERKLDNIKYLICGTGVLQEELQKKVSVLGIEDYVCFLGYRTDVDEICAVSDLFVFMSFQEGLPVALMEAMASGLPVICSEIRGNTDLVSNGVNGEIVNNSAKAVAMAIRRIYRDIPKRKRYSIAAANTVKSFDILQVKKIMYDIYFEQ